MNQSAVPPTRISKKAALLGIVLLMLAALLTISSNEFFLLFPLAAVAGSVLGLTAAPARRVGIAGFLVGFFGAGGIWSIFGTTLFLVLGSFGGPLVLLLPFLAQFLGLGLVCGAVAACSGYFIARVNRSGSVSFIRRLSLVVPLIVIIGVAGAYAAPAFSLFYVPGQSSTSPIGSSPASTLESYSNLRLLSYVYTIPSLGFITLSITLLNKGSSRLTLSSILLDGYSMVQNSGGKCSFDSKTPLGVGENCTSTFTLPTEIPNSGIRGTQYPLKIVALEGNVFVWTIIAGSTGGQSATTTSTAVGTTKATGSNTTSTATSTTVITSNSTSSTTSRISTKSSTVSSLSSSQSTAITATIPSGIAITPQLEATCQSVGLPPTYGVISFFNATNTYVAALSLTYSGRTYDFPQSQLGGCATFPGYPINVYITGLPVAPSAGSQFTGYLVLQDVSKVQFSGTFS